MAKIAALIDDFNGGVINTSLWDVVSGTVTESSGRLILSPTSGVTPLIASQSLYNLEDSSISARIPVITAAGISGTLQSGMIVRRDSNNALGFKKFSSNLYMTVVIAGVETNSFLATYSATTHLYWRIRADTSNVYWETSTTGNGYFIQATQNISALFDVSSVEFSLYAAYTGVESSPTFQIDAVNPGLLITASGTSSTSGSVILLINYRMTASGSSISSGSAALTLRQFLIASGASTSAGSAAFTIPPLAPHAITATGTSTSSGTAIFIILTPGQITGGGQSFSSGSASLILNSILTATGQSFSTGSSTLAVIAVVPDPILIQYFLFEPPIAYDLPPTTPIPRPRYQNAHAKWKPGQRRGRSVLKTGTQYLIVDSPFQADIDAADIVYMGGHIYTVIQEEANALSAAGFTVTAIPADTTGPILAIISPSSGVIADQVLRVILSTSEPSTLTGTLSTGQTTYPIAIPSTSFSIDTSSLANGSYRLAVTATDPSHNSTVAYLDLNILHPAVISGTTYIITASGSSSTSGSAAFYVYTPGTIPYPSLALFPSVTQFPGS